MLKEVKCLACQTILFRLGPLNPEGEVWGVYEEDSAVYDSMHKATGGQEYFECHKCKKKNWIASKKVEGMGLQTWLSHVTE